MAIDFQAASTRQARGDNDGEYGSEGKIAYGNGELVVGNRLAFARERSNGDRAIVQLELVYIHIRGWARGFFGGWGVGWIRSLLAKGGEIPDSIAVAQ